MNKSDFFDQYKNPRWQKKRLEIMQRDEFKCKCCGDDESTLNVHHKYYIPNKAPWDYPENLLVTLCESCHKIEEDSKFIITDFTKVLLGDGRLNSDLILLLDIIRKLPPDMINISGLRLAINEVIDYNPF
jgi:hypothetical protein